MPFVEYDEVGAACADCGRSFPSEEALAAHKAESHGHAPPAAKKQAVECSVCHRKFPSIGQLAEHNRRAHTG
jgi:hypothetical protein